MSTKKELSPEQAVELISTLKARFEKHRSRHEGIEWQKVQARLESKPGKLWSLHQMEATGGEPDVVGYYSKGDEFVFFDCSAESPSGRRSYCYDRESLDARKEAKPADSAMDAATVMGATLLDEQQYRALQELGTFDLKTSSWLATPSNIRKLGGAIFGDRRYDTVFVYHNGASSYYAARGFRCALHV